MIAKIYDNHWINLAVVTQGVQDTLIPYFSARHTRAHYIDTSAEWDGWYRRYNTVKQRLALPFRQDLEECCQKHGIPLDIEDHRPPEQIPSIDSITSDMLAGVTLEEYQLDAIKATLNREIGILSAVTGSGKTEIMCALIKLYGYNTVIITEQLVVLNQIVDRLILRDVAKEEGVGIFCSGHMPSGQKIIVGSIQSITSPTKPKLDDIKVSKDKALVNLLKLIEENSPELSHMLPTQAINILQSEPEKIQNLKGALLEGVCDYFREKDYQRRMKWYMTRHKRAEMIQNLISDCQMMLVDEADLAVSQQYAALCRKIFNGRRRYGVSGTPFDKFKPVENLFLRENLGNIIYEVPRQKVQERNRIIPVHCYFIPVGKDGDRKDSRTYDIAMREEMVDNEKFHNLVAKIITSFKNDRTLILVDTSPVGELGYALEKLIPGSKFLWNKSSPAERSQYIKKFESGELRTLIGGKIFKRGLDLKGGVDNLIIIGGGKQHSNINQMVGRAVRINDRGWARIFCFFFLNNKYLYYHSRENLKAVVGLGYTTKIMFGGKMIDAKSFIKSKFRIKNI